jgi:hypothetical protein
MTRRHLARFRASTRCWPSVLLLAAALGPVPLSAQDAPPDQPPAALPPPNDTPIAGGHSIPGSASSPLQLVAPRSAYDPWNLTLRAGESWERNPMFRPGETRSSFADRLEVGADYLRNSPRSRFSVGAGGTGVRYHSFGDLDHLGGNVSLGLVYSLSPKAMLSLGEALESRWARDSILLVDSGLYYDTVRTLTNRATGELSLRATERTTAAVDVRHEYVNFDSDRLLDGTQIAVAGTLSRRIAPEQTLGATYVFSSSSSSGGPRGTNHTVFGSWAGRLGLRWTGAGSAGAIRSALGQWSPYLGAQLTAELRRTLLYARASRTVSQAYGFGREREVTMVSAGLRQQLGRRLSASIGAGYVRSRELSEGSTPFNGINANGGLSFTLSRHFMLSADGSYRRRQGDNPASPETRASRVGLRLIYERNPR